MEMTLLPWTKGVLDDEMEVLESVPGWDIHYARDNGILRAEKLDLECVYLSEDSFVSVERAKQV